MRSVKKIIWITAVAFLLPAQAWAQTGSDEELAAQYYANEEYEKALSLYENIFKKDKSNYIYEYYLNCLLQLNRLDEAEKVLSKLQRKYPDEYFYATDLAFVYSQLGESRKEVKILDEIVKNVPPDVYAINKLTNALLKRKYNERALDVYLDGRKKAGNPLLFKEEIIGLLVKGNMLDKAIDESVDWVVLNPQSTETVKPILVRLIEDEAYVDQLRQKLLVSIQKNPENAALNDLLMWLFLQTKNYTAAFKQSVAMDKRTASNGSGVLDLAEVCLDNQAFEVAENCYNYIVKQGKQNPNYTQARQGLLSVKYSKLQLGEAADSSQVEDVVADYKTFIQDFGKSYITSQAYLELAKVYLFYQHDDSAAIQLLEEVVDLRGVQNTFRGSAKILLGDAYLISGNVWDAQLTYSQVDKEFKEEPLGQLAKFKNAKLSYYKADFDWAKDQLDVLKTATSQLISNDAIELSLLIQDNTGLDSSTEALEAYSRADLLFFQNKLEDCINLLEFIPAQFPNHSLEDEIYFLKGKVFEKSGDYEKAIVWYEKIFENHASDILADNALFQTADLLENRLKNKEKAFALYERILLEYSSSVFVVETRKRYHRLKKELN